MHSATPAALPGIAREYCIERNFLHYTRIGTRERIEGPSLRLYPDLIRQ